jgi:DNA-directed RNA polymerase subunit RPC12/RpoP
MARDDEPVRPMTLGNMRQNGVRGLDVTCLHCGYRIEVNVDAYLDDVPVPSFGPRMRCSRCGKLGATAIPNWSERADRLPGGARR